MYSSMGKPVPAQQAPLTCKAIGNHLGNPREAVTRMLKYSQTDNIAAKHTPVCLMPIPVFAEDRTVMNRTIQLLKS